MKIQEIIAKVASCNDKESFDVTVKSLMLDISIPANVTECIKNIVNAAKPETQFAATKIRVINPVFCNQVWIALSLMLRAMTKFSLPMANDLFLKLSLDLYPQAPDLALQL